MANETIQKSWLCIASDLDDIYSLHLAIAGMMKRMIRAGVSSKELRAEEPTTLAELTEVLKKKRLMTKSSVNCKQVRNSLGDNYYTSIPSIS